MVCLRPTKTHKLNLGASKQSTMTSTCRLGTDNRKIRWSLRKRNPKEISHRQMYEKLLLNSTNYRLYCSNRWLPVYFKTKIKHKLTGIWIMLLIFLTILSRACTIKWYQISIKSLWANQPEAKKWRNKRRIRWNMKRREDLDLDQVQVEISYL